MDKDLKCARCGQPIKRQCDIGVRMGHDVAHDWNTCIHTLKARIQQLEARNAELEAQIEQNKKEMLAGLAHRDEYATSLEARNAELEDAAKHLLSTAKTLAEGKPIRDLDEVIVRVSNALTAGEVD